MEEQEKVSKRALERWNKGEVDKDYVMLLANEVDKGRKTIQKLQGDLLEMKSAFEVTEESSAVFDEDACVEFIFNDLIKRGIAVSVDDIALIMKLEYDYGVQAGVYPQTEE
ncbi:hypothetical protein [Paenibacillus sabinae]|uniref:Uncharacterized protein n=1 Tax=Paenibacillus sabinae T27 TaxID=1268072 RepID=X4ZUZ1_9BACL|nr:hypothetical protein [Paenibacillus sabinae]AHV96133.1 hypothetical protein PSAB_05985 [Paenibacillus sabinae T27]